MLPVDHLRKRYCEIIQMMWCYLTILLKVACNLVTPVANAVRHCVAFHCLHQMWLSIPFLSQTQLKSIPTSHSCRDELLSIALLLATRSVFQFSLRHDWCMPHIIGSTLRNTHQLQGISCVLLLLLLSLQLAQHVVLTVSSKQVAVTQALSLPMAISKASVPHPLNLHCRMLPSITSSFTSGTSVNLRYAVTQLLC